MIQIPNDLRRNRITVRLDDTEYGELKNACESEGIKQSELVRFAIRELLRFRHTELDIRAELYTPLGAEDAEPR